MHRFILWSSSPTGAPSRRSSDECLRWSEAFSFASIHNFWMVSFRTPVNERAFSTGVPGNPGFGLLGGKEPENDSGEITIQGVLTESHSSGVRQVERTFKFAFRHTL